MCSISPTALSSSTTVISSTNTPILTPTSGKLRIIHDYIDFLFSFTGNPISQTTLIIIVSASSVGFLLILICFMLTLCIICCIRNKRNGQRYKYNMKDNLKSSGQIEMGKFQTKNPVYGGIHITVFTHYI